MMKQRTRQYPPNIGSMAMAMVALMALGACSNGGRSTPTEPVGFVATAGNVTSESRPVQGFDGIVIDTVGFLDIEQTGSESLTITAPDNILPLLTSQVVGSTLMLSAQGDISHQGRGEDLTFAVTLADLHALEVYGAAAIEARRIRTDRLDVRASGATSIAISGATDRQDVTISGAGSYSAGDLESREAFIDLAGACHAVVQVSERLEARVPVASVLEYYGDPIVTVTGGGTVRRLGS